MKHHNNGFTYPLVLCLVIIFLIFFSMQVELLLTKRKQNHEASNIMQEEYYLFSSIRKVENMFQTGGKIPVKGTIYFLKGRTDFQAGSPAGNIQRVQFTLRLNSGETIIGYGYIDIQSKKIVKWTD